LPQAYDLARLWLGNPDVAGGQLERALVLERDVGRALDLHLLRGSHGGLDVSAVLFGW